MSQPKPFLPDWACPPGYTILEILEDRGHTRTDLATRLDLSLDEVQDLLNGEMPLDANLARLLEQFFAVPAKFWNSLETNYRAALARGAAMPQFPISGQNLWAVGEIA